MSTDRDDMEDAPQYIDDNNFDADIFDDALDPNTDHLYKFFVVNLNDCHVKDVIREVFNVHKTGQIQKLIDEKKVLLNGDLVMKRTKSVAENDIIGK